MATTGKRGGARWPGRAERPEAVAPEYRDAPWGRPAVKRGVVAAAALCGLAVGCQGAATLAPVNPDASGARALTPANLPPPEAGISTATPSPPTSTPVPVPTRIVPPPKELQLPPGFQAGVFVENVLGVRMLAYSDSGDLFATVPKENQILAFPDAERDGVADRIVVFAEGEPLNQPHGLAFWGGWLYVANTDSVYRYPYEPGDLVARSEPSLVVANLPGGPQNWTRTLRFGPDDRMYISVGSSCDVCLEENILRARILSYDADGNEGRIYARGLRNAVGLAFQPGTGRLWATENGRDNLGDELPPDELNLIGPGADYGWPVCYGNRVPDPTMGADAAACASTTPPALELQAHSAPLGLEFYTGDAFPPDMADDLYIAYHGSWNRSFPTGYKVVRVPFVDGEIAGPAEDFVSGWLLPDTSRWGRPVDVITAPDGALMVSDDGAGRIYRVVYAPVPPTPTPWH